ncbi:hypothetical protein SAMN04515649_101364 [Eubacterium callanderi]|uniref:Uncharacterized protein n=1 Tax=Eubacterium callanderi TaxID=53442 RepID=A0AB74EUG9_9FIRM|nr:hypothetical protein [Eubacterium callanderi]WPK75204.1 hypothetical protein EUCAG14_07440 [Eubacterium callanderi]SHK95099.1 hypothetical protein SAMN04515649_101364 [Eubacterium callanderi]
MKKTVFSGCLFCGVKNEHLLTNDFICAVSIYTNCFFAYNQTTIILSIIVRTIDDKNWR